MSETVAGFVFSVLAVFVVLYGLGVIWVFWTLSRGAAWVPMPKPRARQMLQMAQVKPGDVVYDLGSGDGRVLFIAAREFGAQAVGIEIDPLRCLWTKLLIRWYGLQTQVRVMWGDFFTQEISQADVVTVFLSKPTNQLLMTRLLFELRPDTRLISYIYTFPGWTPEKLDREARLYLYRVGLKGGEDQAESRPASS